LKQNIFSGLFNIFLDLIEVNLVLLM